MKLSQIKHALNESKKMIREAEEEFGGDNFDQFLASIKEIEKHARERRVLEPDYSKEDLLADIKREIPDVDDKVVSKMADFVFGHLGESTQVTEAQTAEELEVGEPVKITGNVQFQGATGVIDSFGTGKRFVIVDLGEQGLRSFHSSDVSFNAEEEQDEFEGVEESTNPQDTITMDVPLFIRTLEFAREDAKDDMDLHDAAENALKLSANGDTLTMDNYDAIVPSDAVEEAGPGFVDVTGWSSRDVQRLGYADDDYEEPRRNHGYGYNRPAAKPVLSGYYFYNVSPADENDATAIGLKKTKSGKWALAVYNTSGRSTTMKKQSADRAFGPGRWWAPKTESVGEAAEDTFVSALKGLKSWQVTIFNNYYAGKYSDYRGRYYYVIASSPEEAKQVVLDNADGILQDLLSMKSHNGKKILPRGSAIAITDKRIGDIKDGTEAGRMSTTGFKRMFGPQGPMMVKLSGGAVVDVQGQEQGVAEGKYTPASETEEDIFINGKKVGKITKITTKKGMVFYRAEIGNSYIVGADTREEAIRDLKRMRKDQGVAEGTEERGQNRLWQMITDYEQRAKATKNDIKKAHYLKMASELRGKLKTSDEQGVAEGYDKWGWHTSVANGKFMPTKYGNKAYVYLHDLDNEGSKGGPQLVTVNKPAVAKKLAQQFGGKVVKTDLNTYRIVKPAEQDVTEGKDNLESLRAKAKQISDKIDSIVQSGGRVGLDDPLSRQLKAIRNKIKQAKQGVAEDSVKVGDRVHHNEYGKGVVRSVSKDGKIIGVRYKNLTKNITSTGYHSANDVKKIKEQGVAEGRLHNPGQEDSPVAQAIIRRVLLQRTDLLAKYGPGFVGQAIDDVADSVGSVDEIGSSDVSGWIKQVEWNLKNKLNQYDEPMNMDEAGPFSYGAKKPRNGSVADLAAKKRKEQERGKKPIEPKDQMVGNARKVTDEASDISGILGAASMVKDYIITAEVDGTTKKFRVRGMTGPRAAKERFLKHAAYAKVLDVKPVEEKKMNEVTLGDYRKKAAMQRAQSQMGAMFARNPEEREKNLTTFNRRDRGLNRLKARDEAARKAEHERQLADLVARLPELKAEYERMQAEYKSLGGSNWQYADREQNLTDSERKARAMEGPMNNLWRQINAAEKAQGSK